VAGEVEGIDFLLGQIVSAGSVALRARLRKLRKGIQEVLLPCPDHHRSEVVSCLVGRATGIGPSLRDGTLVHPVEKLADLLASQLFDGCLIAPLLPFLDRGEIGILRAAGWLARTKVAQNQFFEARRHFPSLQRRRRLLQCPILAAGGIALHLMLFPTSQS